jgi:hypothetical protein
MVRNLLVFSCYQKLESPMELLLDNDPKKHLTYKNSILKYLKSCLSNQAGFFYLLEYSTKSKSIILGIGNVIPDKSQVFHTAINLKLTFFSVT